MKKLFVLITALLLSFAVGADYKPFTYSNIPLDSATQQTEFNYMLQYKLYGTEYIKMGRRVVIPDKSGWTGSRGPITSAEGISLGGPVLTDSTITLGDQCQFTTGPIRAKSLTTGNDNGQALFGGNICLTTAPVAPTTIGIDRAGGKLSCDSVPPAPVTLEMPTITWPDSGYQPDIILTDNNQTDTIHVPEGDGQYDVYYHNIHTCVGGRNGCKIYIHMTQNRLTRIFVDSLFIGNHTTIAVVLGDSVLPQSKYRGNVLIYSNKNIIFDNTDNVPIQGSFITTAKMYLKCNLDFAGQMLANQLEIGDDFKGENFRFVKFDPDTLDFPALDKQGGLKENDSTVIIPITLSDTATTDVYFTYCFDLKDGVTIEDFNIPPVIPICDSNQVITTKIPIGQRTPIDTIKVNVKKDTLVEPNDYLIMHIDSITGAILPNGETSGELKIKIVDAEAAKNTSIVLDKTDTIKTYQEEVRIPPGTGLVGNIKYTDDGLAPLVWTVEDPSGLFTVEDGVIKTNHVFDYETEDTVYVIKVKVVDGEFADSANYTIKITNIQEPITVTAKIDSVKENSDPGTIVGAIIGKDADSTDVTYSLKDNTNFSIDPVLGVITTKTVFDYETKTTYPITITVTSTDGSKKDTNLVIYVQNVNEPVHVNDTTLTVPEHYIGPIGKVEGKDDDRQPVSYDISDSVHYHIDSLGNITLKTEFDYSKQKTDTLKVVVTDGVFYDTATVVVNIKNVNDPPVLQPNDSLTVPENCKSCIVGIITATDKDDDPIKYTVVEKGFTIDSAGVLKLTDPLDFEKTPTVTVTVIASDPSGAADTVKYTVKVTDINEPAWVHDTTFVVPENDTTSWVITSKGDEDGDSLKCYSDSRDDYRVDSSCVITLVTPKDFEKDPPDTLTIYVTDSRGSVDSAKIVVKIKDVNETVTITDVDDRPKVDTIKTNTPDHTIDWKVCEGSKCDKSRDPITVKRDTTVKKCNAKGTVCDSVVFLFNDAPPKITLVNAKSTDALIDYITIEEVKDDKVYVNKKDNDLKVIVQDTVRNTKTEFPIKVKLDTLKNVASVVKEYNYVLDESLAQYTNIGGGLIEAKEVVNGVTITALLDAKTGKRIDSVQTISYTKTVDGKEVTISYQTDDMTGLRVSDYQVSYKADSATTVTYTLNDKKKIVKNEEGNIAYTVEYNYTDDFGNKSNAKIEIVFDDIPPKVEILKPTGMESFNTNAIEVKWTVNGETQDTLTLQRLEKGVNYIIRRYVDKAGNITADTVTVIMREAKDIDIHIIHPVTEIDQDKVDEFYADHKYDPKKPYTVQTVNPKDDKLPETVGVGLKVDIALPSVSATGGLATLDDIVKNGMIPVDDKGNIVGASTKGIPVDEYVENHCTDEFKEDYKKNGLNIPLYDVTYDLHLWIYTTTANYVNDFKVTYTLNDQDEATEAGTVQMVIDWLADKDGNVKAKNGHALGTGSYITKLFSKSVAKHRCDYKEQRKGDRTVKKEDNMKIFGYKRPKK